MSRGVDAINPSASVQEAAILMAELDVGAIFVGTEDAITGILTDRDVLLRVVVDGRNPVDVKVGEVMSATLLSCKEDDTVESVIATMRERQIRRMPVYNARGKPVGVVALSDLAKSVGGPEQAQEALREMSEPRRRRKDKEAPDDAAPEAGAEGDAPKTAANNG